MASISLSVDPATSVVADVLVVGMAKSDRGPVLAVPRDAPAALRAMEKSLAAVGATGGAEELVRLPAPAGVAAASVLAVGLGDRSRRYTAEQLRRAAGTAARGLAGTSKVALALPTPDAAAVEAVAVGALLGAYAFQDFRGRSADPRKAGVRTFVLAGTAGRDERGALVRARALAEGITLTRDLVNTPPNALTPKAFADRAVREAGRLGLTVSVLDERALRRGGYGGIIGVGQGSAHPPRLVRLEYRHPRARAHLALAGKGITFDSGGISIKPAQGMDAMKSDMGGAAAVLGALVAIGRTKPVVRVTGWLPLAENMPGGAAQRPSDVITIYGGRTVEVLNTDAEGRLILADALVAAAEEHPDVLVDVATLTGAARVALGARTAGIMANDDDFLAQVHDASGRAGEAMWPMPLPEELRRGLDSQVADIANIDGARLAGMLSAATFLREFVPDDLRWAHLDIAGPAFHESGPYGYTPKGGTGVAVRTLVQLAEDLAEGRIAATER